MFSVKLNNQQHLKEQIKHSSYFVGLSRVFVCVHLRTFLVGRPSHLCVCRVGTPPARKYI